MCVKSVDIEYKIGETVHDLEEPRYTDVGRVDFDNGQVKLWKSQRFNMMNSNIYDYFLPRFYFILSYKSIKI